MLSSSALSRIGSLNIDMSMFGKSKSASPVVVRANVSAPTSLELLDPRRQVCVCVCDSVHVCVCVTVYMCVCDRYMCVCDSAHVSVNCVCDSVCV